VSVDIEPKEETNSERTTTPEWATLIIQDHGPGIPRALLTRLFERYVKGQHSLGIGLGLYVSYRIVEAHGGTLTAESIPGQGARFTIRLPLLVDS
jgi:signal transduction histidine kinase